MALDMEQLRKMFYEECRENLEVLEDVLLNLDPTQVEEESINTIFRAAHSIKGGAGTFNLLDISEFTHNVEAYLDLVRNNERSLSAETIDLLLKSGDCIHSMLEGHELGNEVNVALKEEVGLKLAELLGEAPTDTADVQPEQNQEATSSNSNQPWSITFSPHPEMFFSGNDPLRILRELKDLDESCQIIADTTKLPEIDDIEAELCFLSWTAELDSSVEEAQIQEVFEWVEDECDLTIEKASAPQAEDASSDIVENAAEQTKAESVESAASEVANTAKSKEPNKSTKVAKSDSNVSSIRVDIDKVDSLINLVGELVITQSMLTEIGNDFTIEKLEKLKTGLDQLLQNSKDLQENVLNIRMLPMSFAFSRFPRLVRDLSSRLDKQVDLQIKGEQTELDKTVLERIVDPLVHLVRNGIDHGIEQPQQRLDAGKSEMGTIGLNAYHQGGSIVIEIKDDGAGLNCDKLWNKALEKGVLAAESRREEYSDKQIMNLIFAPGFSTAEEVSDISGRGVGMDVVRRNIEELGGHIEVESALGEGSCFTIS